ncbi:MAG: hypothetical protein OEL87_00785 [Nanoarchaeota archaeon]|nr:hypothetical protein [Nanoarchaeota archaeon]
MISDMERLGWSFIEKDSIEGFVLEPILGEPCEPSKFVMGGIVYQSVFGTPEAIGYVKDGRAYIPVFGGPDIPIGRVEELRHTSKTL